MESLRRLDDYPQEDWLLEAYKIVAGVRLAREMAPPNTGVFADRWRVSHQLRAYEAKRSVKRAGIYFSGCERGSYVVLGTGF